MALVGSSLAVVFRNLPAADEESKAAESVESWYDQGVRI